METTSDNNEVMNSRNLPDGIYASVVQSLYADARSLFVGILTLTIAPIILFLKSGDHFQLVFSCLFMIFGVLRMLLAREYALKVDNNTSRKLYTNWESKYLYSSSIYVALLGLWFITSVAQTKDPFAGVLSLSLSLCYMIGIIGRNFGSERVVVAQVTIASVFIIVGLAMSGGYYNVILAAFLIPFFVAIRMMSARLREMLLSAAINAEENHTIAKRFDTALENVAHGVAMFDRSGKITVANERFLELTELNERNVVGKNLSQLEIPNAVFTQNIETFLGSNTSHQFCFQLDDKQIVEVDYNAMEGGGVVVLSDITERMISERAIRNLANFDPLTKLPNRRCFMNEVDKRLVKDGKLEACAMLFLDLDKFKEVNDALGHAIGDKLLQAVADRIKSLIRSVDMVCRFGGDEFLIIVPGEIDIPRCSHLCEEIIQELNKSYQIEQYTIDISASIGISMAPRDGNEPDVLLQHADVTLYHVKASGRGTYAYYSSDLGKAIQLKRELELYLREAIENEALEVHFQPLVNISQSRVTTCEALVRWTNEKHGRIPPDKFIKIAEEANLIHQLGVFVLRESMLECLKWPEHVDVAVNVSSIQFHRYDIYATLKELLEETGLPGHRLQIEVTESVMLENVEDAANTLSRIAELGVKISLDDFGTGFSNLSYLHKLPFDKIKIDRSFIQDGIIEPRSFTLLKGVVSLIKSLGLSVVLEGIESEDQLRQLTKCVGVDEVQGYLFSRPLPQEDITKLLCSDSPEKATDLQRLTG
ncbi:MAG: EAL domain-containing protein [Pseudomonadota bacterium]